MFLQETFPSNGIVTEKKERKMSHYRCIEIDKTGFIDMLRLCLKFIHRFSLLLLEPNEIYFEDFLVNLITESPSDDIIVPDEQRYIGRLKMCSKSIVFDPKDFDLPLIKITYKNCSRIFIWPGKINGKESNVLAVSCNQYTEMLSKNIVAPYTFKMEARTFLFNFHYAKVYEYLDQLRQLHRASKLHACEQNDMVRIFVEFAYDKRIANWNER